MIGTRAAMSAGAAVVFLSVSLGQRLADPATDQAARGIVRDRATLALGSIESLRRAAQPGLDAARSAAAAVLSSAAPPGPRIQAAADILAGTASTADRVREDLAALDRASRAWRPDAFPLPRPIQAGELTSIASQLEAAVEPANTFAEVRRAATGVPELLRGALLALDAGALDEAGDLAIMARDDHDAVVAWETDHPALPVWIATTDAMIESMERIVDATRSGDPAAATRAAEDFTALADHAARADRALRIALGEEGSALTATALGRLAAVLGAIEEAYATATAVRDATDR